jgi:hypothetical protein
LAEDPDTEIFADEHKPDPYKTSRVHKVAGKATVVPIVET